MDIRKIKDWGLKGSFNRPILISGPCSAETPEQVLQSCIGAKAQGASILRAGIWKPRTRPDSFQGVGKIGLPWVKEASRQTGLPVMVEVASALHVEDCLQEGIDILWIGARSTTNPFTVQEIADALKGVDIPVFIKNPINPDLDLWLGAVERLYRSGIQRVALIHRGFSVYKSAPYRNAPMWQIPIELRRRFPQFDIICDPSHICGTRALLLPVAQKALDLDFDGLMIESHINPDEAWSDAKQQVTPEQLGELLEKLVQRNPTIENPDLQAKLEHLRHEIDILDKEIIQLLAKRMKVSQTIGSFKKESGVTILQINRWSEIFDSRVDYTIKSGLSAPFAKEFIQSIHDESIRQQENIMNNQQKPVSKKNILPEN